MQLPATARHYVRFGPYTVDFVAREVRNGSGKIPLQDKPFQILAILLEQPGELVTREQLRERLWPADTYVDFDHSINTAIKKLREALEHNGDEARYIETLPKRGYRFIGSSQAAAVEAPVGVTEGPATDSPRSDRRVREGILVALAVVLIAAGVMYRWLRPRTPVVTGIHQLTRTGHAKFSSYGIHRVVSDGTRLYFNDAVAFNSPSMRLAQISVNGGEVSYIDLPTVPHPELVGSNDDGSELLVISQFTSSIDGSIWLAKLPNGPQRKIGGMDVAFGALTPGGRKLVYTEPTNLTRLLISDVTGGGSRVLMATPREIYPFSLSPDGKRIRFEMSGGLWEASLEGTGLHRFLPQYAERMCCGAWSRDGKIYSFAREEDGINNLWEVTETTWFQRHRISTPTRLTYGPISFSTPTFSKDGRQMYALGLIQRGELAVYDKGKNEFIPYMGGLSAGYLDFSADGQWVAYVTYPQRMLWRSRTDGSERLQLTFSPMRGIVNPKWSPDGRWIAFTEWGDLDKKVYVISATGGNPKLLLSGSFNPTDPTWSPDGKSIAYSGVSIADGSGTEVRILDLGSGQSKTIPGSEHMFSSRWSPDGRYIAALSDDTSRLFVYSFEVGRWKELISPERQIYPGWPSWSRDSRSVYVIGGAVHKVRVADGQAEVVVDTAGIEITCPQFHSTWFGLTPDERVIVMRDRGSDELYALDLEYR